ncbi:hypothetical protein [Dactylosporangium sp. NPDC048998]|uniref:hypothetical protein n=1 Tax=Dactylosporangium sp. NPDC048998 TaxID=3363976 RepID=UPI003713D90E
MADQHKIEINATGMKDFSAKLQSYVDKDLAPGGERIKNQLAMYPTFGVHTASPVVHQAAVQYWEQMEAAMAFLDALTHNAAVLARTAQEIVTTYRDVDDHSATFLRGVVSGASTEVSQAERAAQDADQRAKRNELHELHQARGGK